MRLRRLNDAGLEMMSAFLHSLSTEEPDNYPRSILADSRMSEDLPVGIEVDRERSFPRRFEGAAYLYEQLAPLRSLQHQRLERDRGLWAWLSLFWFDRLCPTDAAGRSKPGELAHWIPEFHDARRYYRHFLFGAYTIYRAHADNPKRAMVFLCQPLSVLGHAYYQLASRQYLITSAPVIEAATTLYYDDTKKMLRRGSQDYGANGTVFRFADVLMQFDKTFDLHTITAARLLDLLPEEFNRFRDR